MSPFWLFAILLLAAGFGVLVWTFVFIARLLAERQAAANLAPATATPPADPDAAAAEAEAAAAEEAAAEEERRRTGVGVNATLGLVLSLLACALFWLSPLILILSAAGIYFSAGALWLGLSRYRVFITRAAIGLALGAASVVGYFAWQMGMFAHILPP